MNHILLLHGALGSSEDFDKLKPLLEKNYIVHTINFPGHGGNEMAVSFSIDFFADYVEEYCTINSLSGVYVFGYSMGGYVALYLAHKNPSLFKKIVTLGTVLYWDETIAAKEISKLQPSVIEEKVPQFAASLKALHHPNDWKEVLNKTADMLKELGRNNLLTSELLSEIQTPTLLMLGDRDKMVSRAKTIEVFDLLPSSQLAILPNTPHPLQACDEGLVALMISKFLG
jgi:pimeloyl-ACP methyl ester carboxylesterase